MSTTGSRKVIKLIFIFNKFIFSKHQFGPLQNSSLGQLHIEEDVFVYYLIETLEVFNKY